MRTDTVIPLAKARAGLFHLLLLLTEMLFLPAVHWGITVSSSAPRTAPNRDHL